MVNDRMGMVETTLKGNMMNLLGLIFQPKEGSPDFIRMLEEQRSPYLANIGDSETNFLLFSFVSAVIENTL
jgi:hypothetical protein